MVYVLCKSTAREGRHSCQTIKSDVMPNALRMRTQRAPRNVNTNAALLKIRQITT